MILVIGGVCQGKLGFVRHLLNVKEENITDGEFCRFDEAFQKPVLNKMHLFVKRLRAVGMDPLRFIAEGIGANPGITVICDELSTALVPVEKEDRELQELLGRVQCAVAQRADRVYRVFCAIPVRIK